MRWWKRKERERDLERELRSDLELEAAEQEEKGLSAEEARHAARRALGNTTYLKEEVREMWGWTTCEQVAQDVRYAFRMMRKGPGFTMVAVMSLALGVGATTSVFSVLNAVVLRPLPVAEPERLVVLQPELRGKRFVLFNPLFESLRDAQQSLAGIFAVSDEPFLKVTFDRSAPTYVRASFVSGSYFETLGLSPTLGRLLGAADDERSPAYCAAVVSHSFWTNRLHSDAAILGRRALVRETDCTIVGVAPADFRSHQVGYAPDIWLPLRPLTDPKLLASRGMSFFSGVMGRLRPGVTLTQAETELTALYQRANTQSPQPRDFKMTIAPGAQGLDAVRRRFEQPLFLVLAVVGVVLLVASVNVANLLLARGAARSAELATRAALGASRARLVRQMTLEGAILAVCGGFLGIAIAFQATPSLARLVSLPNINAQPDLRVFGVGAAATLFTALLAGVVPAWRFSGMRIQAHFAGAGRATTTRSGQRLARTLVAAQLALSLALVTSAGLLLRSIWRVMAIDPGFNARNVVLMDIRDTEPSARFGETDTAGQMARRASLYQALDRRLNGIPGVQAASVSWLGLFGGNYVGVNLYDVERPEDRRFTLTDYVSPGYFETIGMQVVRGRGFTEDDREGALRVAVVNQAFARERIPGGREAIGRRIVMTYGTDPRPFTIVGIVRDAKYNDPREGKTEPMMWVSLAQTPVKVTSLSLRVQSGPESAVIRQAEAALKAASPYLMIRKVTTLRAQVDQATARERLLMSLASCFGGFALLLAAVGLYGTLAYAVAGRTREIGVRLALGAQRGAVLRLVLVESLTLVAGGMLAGIPLSLAAGYLLRSFLFGVTTYDMPTLIGASAVLTAVALLAAFLPARRASRVDPMAALKYD
jgi:predicted permease